MHATICYTLLIEIIKDRNSSTYHLQQALKPIIKKKLEENISMLYDLLICISKYGHF